MTIIDTINSIPQIYIYLMGLILIIAFAMWVIKKMRFKGEDNDTEEIITDPKDEYLEEEVSYDDVYDKERDVLRTYSYNEGK